jgi:PAS domain S-box-containing protein
VASGSGIGSYAAFGLVENGQLLVVVSLFASETGFFGLEEQALVGALRDEIEFALERLELDRKRLDAEEALAKSEHAYRRFFEDNPLPMWIYDPQTFEFLAVNDAAAAKYGYTRDQFRRMTIKDIRPAADVASLVDHVAHTGAGFEDAGFWTHVDSEGREFPVHVVTHDTEWEGRAARLVLVQEIAQVR